MRAGRARVRVVKLHFGNVFMQAVGTVEEPYRRRIVRVRCLRLTLKGVREIWLAVAIRSFGEKRSSLIRGVRDIVLSRIWKQLHRC